MDTTSQPSDSHAVERDKKRTGRPPSLNLSDLTPEEIARQVLTTPPPSATLVGKTDPDPPPDTEGGD